ncbi:gastrula zinc finger protein XlCGF8.2DB-like [Cotesia glomerata]|uniref:C2H2-type domain-containing protein n=1 Tax=Cotesia glomerata TaxID=32391 RepID=A0AAV7J001_COTGL|nr:gastrula zinc finger protein XlCGF8.2DB-like [Cotesia glomerata]KAH0561559.1 hypothetical protein KQX54_017640 [Cotesia glomerata]
MSAETLPFENIVVKVEKCEDEDFNQQCPEIQESCDEHKDPLHDFPIDTEEIKVEISEDSELPGDIADASSLIKIEAEEAKECAIKTEPLSSPINAMEMLADLRKVAGKKHLVKRKWKRPRSQRIKKDWYPKNWICDVCSAKFAFKSGLARHEVSHTDDRPFACTICSWTFRYLDNLNRHLRIHATGEQKGYICDVCSIECSSGRELATHKRSHLKPKPFMCKICKSRYHTDIGLRLHMRVHTHKFPFTCVTCLATFDKRLHLVNHMKTHIGEKISGKKTFDCQICSWTCNRKFQMTKHMEMHAGENLFTCDVCSAKFRNKTSLTTHMAFHKNEKSKLVNSRGSKGRQKKTSLDKSLSEKTNLKSQKTEVKK